MPGNKRIYSRAEYEAVMALVRQGQSLTQIEAVTGVSRSAVARMRSGKWQGVATSRALTGRSALTRALSEHLDAGHELDELTVLTIDNDPFRQDTETRHEAAAWLVATARAVGIDFAAGDTRHLRGLHYTFLGQARPDGKPYANTYEQWCWLYGTAAKAARWLGYVEFDQIIDQRNAEPVIYTAPSEPVPRITRPVDAGEGWEFSLPDAEQFAPAAELVAGNIARQPYRIALVGEKSSLEPVLGPLARQYGTDLYLPTGEISETRVHRMAAVAAHDGRPLVVLYFADCDPAGWQMGISVGRKLQAFRALLDTPLEFALYRVALAPDQVRELGLPSTPLKETERRADKWQQAMGVEQTEVDALMALRPGELDRIAREAIGQFRDPALGQRAGQAAAEWRQRAQQVIDDGLDGDREEILAAARDKLSRASELVTEVRRSLITTATADDLPAFTPPEPEVPPPSLAPLVSSEWDYAGQCRALRESKAYGGSD